MCMSRIVNNLIQKGYLRTDRIIDAFSEIGRVEFIPENLQHNADADIALPIGYGQTISQPLTTAFMFELLDPQKGHNILDVGSGSGWTTSLLSYIVREEGKVTALEIIPELCEQGKVNADKYKFIKKGIAEFYSADALKGYPENAPYDRILVSAAVNEIPQALKDQLKVGGKIVIPVRNDVWYLEKIGQDEFRKEEFPGFNFVPFIEKTDF